MTFTVQLALVLTKQLVTRAKMTLKMNYSSYALDSELVWHLGKLLFVSLTLLSSWTLWSSHLFLWASVLSLDLPIAHVSLSSYRKVGHCVRNITQICNSLEEANKTFYFSLQDTKLAESSTSGGERYWQVTAHLNDRGRWLARLTILFSGESWVKLGLSAFIGLN